MLHLFIYYMNRRKSIYLPDVQSTSLNVVLPVSETQWDRSIEVPMFALDGIWHVTCPADMRWNDDTPEITERILEVGLNLTAVDENVQIGFLCNSYTLDDGVFKYYKTGTKLQIGKSKANNQVVIDDPYISDNHGMIEYKDDAFIFTDTSKNGTYINDVRINHQSLLLAIGDVISFACGFKIVFLGTFVAMNGTSTEAIRLDSAEKIAGGKACLRTEAYHLIKRPPHFVPNEDIAHFEIENPPQEETNEKLPLFLTIGPSLTMCFPMLLGTIFAGNSTYASYGVIMMVSSSALSVTWMLINNVYGKKHRGKIYRRKLADYLQRIGNVEQDIQKSLLDQKNQMLYLHPSTRECYDFVMESSKRIWERVPTANEFLSVRLGLGNIQNPCTFKVPAKRMGEQKEGIDVAPYAIEEKYSIIANAPITVDMKSRYPIGIIGKYDALLYMQNVIIQLACLHSYVDLRIMVLCNPEDSEMWHGMRWLPHTRFENTSSMHMIASEPAEQQQLLNHINEIILLQQNEKERKQEAKNHPFYVLFCSTPEILYEHSAFHHLIQSQSNVSVCIIAEEENMLPKECAYVLNPSESVMYDYINHQKTQVRFEYMSWDMGMAAAKAMARMREKERLENAAIPELVTLLDAHKATDVSQLNIWRQWNENSTSRDITSFIGLRAGGRPFLMNMSDKAYGPHGIVAGTTGSGKSVLLQSLVLSLAIRYHPSELQFILIDYKGGGSFNDFVRLPHVVGLIDNLQGERAIRRALFSVRGEVERREEIFKQVGVSDINDYIRRFNHQPQHRPLSHLIIIIDEFAQLKDEMPDFMSELIATSRIGRSVGVHLILATQKPSSSVSGEIWSNSRFHICLRVQTREDSMEMLHRPDAAFLKGMGRGYVQVGNDELFEEVQTAWNGAPYETGKLSLEETARMLDSMGRPMRVEETDKAKTDAQLVTQAMAIMDAIQTVCVQHDIDRPAKLWLDEMPKIIPFDSLPNGRGQFPAAIPIPCAILDDVDRQMQVPLAIDPIQMHNIMFVGPSVSGKTTALQTIAWSAAMNYSADEVQIVILSLSGMQLNSLSTLPNVIDIITAREVQEQKRLLNILCEESVKRTAQFAEMGTDNFVSCNQTKKMKGENPIPALLVMVDRFSQWMAVLNDNEQEKLALFVKESAGQGIFFIATTLETRDVPYGLKESFKYIPLRLQDRNAYMDALSLSMSHGFSSPADVPGRGMIKVGGAPYELHIALPFGEQSDSLRGKMLLDAGLNMTRRMGVKAIETLHIPEHFTSSYMLETQDACTEKYILSAAFKQQDAKKVLLDLYEKNSVFVYGKRESGKTSLLRALGRFMQQEWGARIVVISTDTTWAEWGQQYNAVYADPNGSIDGLIGALSREFTERLAIRKAHKDYNNPKRSHAIAQEFVPLCIILDNVDVFYGQARPNGMPYLSADHSSLISNALEKGKNYGISVFSACNAGKYSNLPNPDIEKLKAISHGVTTANTICDSDPWGLNIPYSKEYQSMKAGEGFIIQGSNVVRVLLPGDA